MALMNEERSPSLVEDCHSAQQETDHEIAGANQSSFSLAGGGQTSGTSQTGGRVHFASSTARVAPEPPKTRQRSASMFTTRPSAGALFEQAPGRRRSSLMQTVREMLPAAAAEGNSKATGDAEDGVADVQGKFNELVKQLVDEMHATVDFEEPITEWRRAHLGEIDDPRMVSFFNDALPGLMKRHVELERNRRIAEKRTVCWTVMLTVFDTLSDYSAYAVLRIDGSGYATPMLVVLVVSMACQALTAHYVTKEGNFATVGALFGFKPIIDGINIVFDLEPQTGALPSLVAFGWTRVVETTSESIPFIIMQSLALIERRSIAQWISFAISVANIAHAVASVDYGFDTSVAYRALEPLCYGSYKPGSKGDGLFAAVATFAVGYVTAKVVAIAVLGSVSGAMLASVLVAESIAFLLVRFATGTWRFYTPAGDFAVASLAVHFLGAYPVLIAAPFPMAPASFPRFAIDLLRIHRMDAFSCKPFDCSIGVRC